MLLKIKSSTAGEQIFEWDEKSPLLIGRSDSCGLVLADKKVSRKHALLTGSKEAFFIEDQGSNAGTKVNEIPAEGRKQLRDGDTVTLGETQIRFVVIPEQTSPQKTVTPASDRNHRVLPCYPMQEDLAEIYSEKLLALSAKLQNHVLELLNLDAAHSKEMSSSTMRPKVEQIVDQVLREKRHEIPAAVSLDRFRQIMLDDLTGLGPLSPLLRDTEISEIMINGPDNIFVESRGLSYRSAAKFQSEAHLQAIIQRIVEPLGRHVDAASPMVDARLEDGSRVNAVIPPLALDGSLVTIRKFPEKKLTDEDLIKFGSLNRPTALFLREAVRAGKNILVAGGTGSGKTTLLNILSQFIPEKERVITVEDSADLKLSHENLCRLEARPANIEGQGRVSIRDLVINTLRMRPDRIIVGECRGPEALDMLQAMNTGHDGSMTTCHANTPRDALSRLENMVMMAGFELPSSAIRDQIASAIHLIVQQLRLADGSRKIVKISEVTGREGNTILLQDIFSFEQEGFDENFRIKGYHTATGNIPKFVDELRAAGDLELDMSVFVPER